MTDWHILMRVEIMTDWHILMSICTVLQRLQLYTLRTQ